jgi:membrane protein DedA with SNARE-associated domain
VPTIDQAFAWLIALPPVALYAMAFGLALFENIFPPFPADVFIGLCAFIAARGNHPLSLMIAAVVGGNLSGALLTYSLGRRYGAAGLHARMEAKGMMRREARLESMYQRYGLAALFIGRLLPGIRGIVPLVAGAFRIHAVPALSVIAIASTAWYSTLVVLAFRVGNDWDAYEHTIAAYGRWGTLIAFAVALVAVVAGWVLWRRRGPRT